MWLTDIILNIFFIHCLYIHKRIIGHGIEWEFRGNHQIRKPIFEQTNVVGCKFSALVYIIRSFKKSIIVQKEMGKKYEE